MTANITPIGKGPHDLALRGERMLSAVHETIQRLTIKMQGHVKDKKLSGQVLNVGKRGGRLRRSINQKFNATGPSGPVGTVGTNVSYARVHELGFSGDVQVREHMRKIKEAWGKPLAEPIEIAVRAHTRAMNMPVRSFLRTALADIQPEVLPSITAAVERANAKP